MTNTLDRLESKLARLADASTELASAAQNDEVRDRALDLNEQVTAALSDDDASADGADGVGVESNADADTTVVTVDDGPSSGSLAEYRARQCGDLASNDAGAGWSWSARPDPHTLTDELNANAESIRIEETDPHDNFKSVYIVNKNSADDRNRHSLTSLETPTRVRITSNPDATPYVEASSASEADRIVRVVNAPDGDEQPPATVANTGDESPMTLSAWRARHR